MTIIGDEPSAARSGERRWWVVKAKVQREPEQFRARTRSAARYAAAYQLREVGYADTILGALRLIEWVWVLPPPPGAG